MGGHWSWDVETWGRCCPHLISTEAGLDASQEWSFTCRASSALLCRDNSIRFGSIGTSPVYQHSPSLSMVESVSAVFISVNVNHRCQYSWSHLHQHKSSLSILTISINTDHLHHYNTSLCIKLISINIADHYRYNPFLLPINLSLAILTLSGRFSVLCTRLWGTHPCSPRDFYVNSWSQVGHSSLEGIVPRSLTTVAKTAEWQLAVSLALFFSFGRIVRLQIWPWSFKHSSVVECAPSGQSLAEGNIDQWACIFLP